ncbi:hypothetical protein CS062_13260 [Roseateles chitinivorans]|uniref:Uncharacterized protein n=1 Tax=Roseateles chitinivorans TaxID=2917965 RepID=A0A2G9CB42_9BURK|nr:hypothetical protein [Roseateles chitinivorans]PIM52729.1 hypothetical protein CS062_13260 [Roseateles chitinivorans]
MLATAYHRPYRDRQVHKPTPATEHPHDAIVQRGGRAELRHNPTDAVRKAVTVAAKAGVTYWLWQHRRRDGTR